MHHPICQRNDESWHDGKLGLTGTSRVADSSLAFFKEVKVLFQNYAIPGSLAQVIRMSRRVPEANLESPAHGVRVPLGLESCFGRVRHKWLYRIAPRIIETHKAYHDDNVGTLSAGMIQNYRHSFTFTSPVFKMNIDRALLSNASVDY